jgi:hypothetical protein
MLTDEPRAKRRLGQQPLHLGVDDGCHPPPDGFHVYHCTIVVKVPSCVRLSDHGKFTRPPPPPASSRRLGFSRKDRRESRPRELNKLQAHHGPVACDEAKAYIDSLLDCDDPTFRWFQSRCVVYGQYRCHERRFLLTVPTTPRSRPEESLPGTVSSRTMRRLWFTSRRQGRRCSTASHSRVSSIIACRQPIDTFCYVAKRGDDNDIEKRPAFPED